jgi:hypothetical protein
MRGIKFNDCEWRLIRQLAKDDGLSVREYLFNLVENDKDRRRVSQKTE